MIINVFDNDDAGKDGSAKLATELKHQSPNSEIKIANWGDDKLEKFDVTDHFSQEKDKHELLDDFDDILEKAEEFTLKIPKKIGVFNIMTGKEASKTIPPPAEWLIENILPKAFNCLLAGMTGAKKSLYAMQLGMYLANGENEFCGNKIIPIRTNVLYVDTENGVDESHRRFKSIQKRMNWSGDEYFNMISKSGTVLDVWDNVHEAYHLFRPDLIIFDSLYNSTSVGDFSRADQIQKVTNSLTEFKDRYGITILAVHHFNKGGKELGLDIDRITGASQLMNWLEWCMIMVKTNVPDFNLWKVVKSRGFFHDESIVGLRWNNFQFEAKGVIEDCKPFLITDEKRIKWQIVLEDCPDQFDSQQWINVFNTKFKMSERTGRQWLKECCESPMLEKMSHDHYQKKLKIINEDNIDE